MVPKQVGQSGQPIPAPEDTLTLDTPTLSLLGMAGSAGTIQITFPPDSADSYFADSTCRRGDKLTGAPSATAYVLYATAQGDQVNDKARNGTSCATMCLGSNGSKQPPECWE